MDRPINNYLTAGTSPVSDRESFLREPGTEDVRGILGQTVVDRGMIAPIAENADGSFSLAWPQMIYEPFAAAGRMMSPGYDYSNTKRAAADALSASSLGVTGGMAGRMAGRAAGAVANPVADLPAHLRPQPAATRVAEYTAQRMSPDDAASVTLQRAYEDFKTWAAANGKSPGSFDDFRLAMQEAGYRPHNVAGANRFVGVGVPEQAPAGSVQRYGPMNMGAANDDLSGPWAIK